MGTDYLKGWSSGKGGPWKERVASYKDIGSGSRWIVQENKFSFSFVPPPEELVLKEERGEENCLYLWPIQISHAFRSGAQMLMQEAWMEAIGWIWEKKITIRFS